MGGWGFPGKAFFFSHYRWCGGCSALGERGKEKGESGTRTFPSSGESGEEASPDMLLLFPKPEALGSCPTPGRRGKAGTRKLSHVGEGGGKALPRICFFCSQNRRCGGSCPAPGVGGQSGDGEDAEGFPALAFGWEGDLPGKHLAPCSKWEYDKGSKGRSPQGKEATL